MKVLARGRGRRLLLAGTTAGALALTVGGADAVLPGVTFEGHDGDLAVTTQGNLDWNSPAPGFANGIDLATGSGDNSFGQGTSENSPVPSVVDGSIPNNKSDLKRFYVGSETKAINSVEKTFLYLAWTRVQAPTGTTNMDFELNKSRTLSANGVTPVRTAGDVLIKYDLASGGTTPILGFHKWITAETATEKCQAGSVPCWDSVQRTVNGKTVWDARPLNGGIAEGKTNSTSVLDRTPIVPPAVGSGLRNETLGAFTFGEAAINLFDSGIFTGGCPGFATAYVKSRSSDSFTAALKDFIAPIESSISSCGPLRVNAVKKAQGTNELLAGATFTLSEGGTVLGTCTTDATGGCTFADVTGTGMHTYTITETAAPPGYQLPDPAPTATCSITFTTQLQTCTREFFDSPTPVRINIAKTDDRSTVPLEGATFTVYADQAPASLTEPGAEDDDPLDTCTTDSDGACSFDPLPPGAYWVVETGTPSGYDTADPQRVVIAVGDSTKTLTFRDPRLHKAIVLTCHTGSSTLTPSGVVFGSDASQQSIGSVPAALAAKGVTEADLCAIGGATKSGLDHGALSSTITIGGH